MPAAAPSGRDADALRSLARRIDPSDPGAQNNLGVFYYERGLIPEAIAAFGRALELDPEMRVAQDNLETLQRESGYYDTRIGELRERLAREPGARAVRLELGRGYFALGPHDPAALPDEGPPPPPPHRRHGAAPARHHGAGPGPPRDRHRVVPARLRRGSGELGGPALPRPGALQSRAQRQGALGPHRGERVEPRSRGSPLRPGVRVRRPRPPRGRPRRDPQGHRAQLGAGHGAAQPADRREAGLRGAAACRRIAGGDRASARIRPAGPPEP